MPPTLDYSRPIVARDTNAVDDDLLPLAIYSGAAPLTLLIITFVLWIPTRWMFLEFLGLWTIMLGLVMFVVGIICVIAYIPSALLGGDLRIRTVLLRATIAVALLLLNFACSVGVIAAVVVMSPSVRTG